VTRLCEFVTQDENPEEEPTEIEMSNLAPEHITPEAAASMTPVQQTQFLKRKAFKAVFWGLGLIMVLTDPMVDALAEFSKRIHIPPFFVAFVLAPLASSSLEIVSACEYASKKTVKAGLLSV
jgi:Ca2+/H+ antiporter